MAAAIPISETAWEVHCGASQSQRGRPALAAFSRLIQRFWDEHPSVFVLVGVMEAAHRAARINAVRLGFVHFMTAVLPWPDGTSRLTACYRLERS